LNVDTLIYVGTLVGLYSYLNWRGSVAFLWACVFVLFQWCMYDLLGLDVNTSSIVSGVSLIVTFEIGSRLWEDPFSKAHTVQALSALFSLFTRFLGVIGIKPKITLVDYRGSDLVQKAIYQLQASNWHALESSLKTMESNTRYDVMQALVDETGRSDAYDEWICAHPQSAIANIVSGFQYINWAWEARGGGVASTVTERGIELFYERLDLAKENFELAIKTENKFADPYIGLITIAMGTGFEREHLWDYFVKAMVHCKDHYQAHVSMINALAEKWGGNENEMFSVANQGTNSAENNNALAAVIAEAYIEKWLYLLMCDMDEEAEVYFRDKDIRQKLTNSYNKIKLCSLEKIDNVQALNSLAFCFYMSGLNSQAKEVIEKLEGRFVEHPWQYLDEPFLASFNPAYAVDHVLEKLNMVSDNLPDLETNKSSSEQSESPYKSNNAQEITERRVFKTPIIVPLSISMVILIFLGYPLLSFLDGNVEVLESLKSISFEVFVLCNFGLISLIITSKKHLNQFLNTYPVIQDFQALEAFKPVARTNMYSALIGFFFMGLGSLTAIMTIVNLGFMKSIIVVVLTIIAAIMMSRYTALEEKVKQIECVDENLEEELRAILDCWMNKALPDF